MERLYISELVNNIGKEVTISGWINGRRDHGKIIFVDIRDKTGIIQSVCFSKDTTLLESVSATRPEWVVEVKGIVNTRPAKMITSEDPMGAIELEITSLLAISKSEELPFDKDSDLNLDTYFDYLPLTLRREDSRNIFRLQSTIVNAYRQSLISQDFMEFQAPSIVGSDAEGGAAVFKVNYYYDTIAYLATSPQLYKQIMIGAFEKVFTVGQMFRAEKHATTRHLSEITQMDFEMGFIKNHTDVMRVLEKCIKDVVDEVSRKHSDIFHSFNIPLPMAPDKFPILKLSEAMDILEKEFGSRPEDETDLDPESEKQICEWALKEYGSDFIFITHYPTKARSFYTYPEDNEPSLSRSFDLLFRGLEINSGSQRIHNYNDLIEKMKTFNLDPDKFSFYLQAFKYGLPPHGGCSTGLERLTSRMLMLPNVKKASAFPRDMNRIDTLLSKQNNNE